MLFGGAAGFPAPLGIWLPFPGMGLWAGTSTGSLEGQVERLNLGEWLSLENEAGGSQQDNLGSSSGYGWMVLSRST